jgi:hypothetical protein
MFVELGIERGETLPLFRQLALGEAGVEGASLYACIAVDALLWVDEELLLLVIAELAHSWVDAVDRTDLNAGLVFLIDAGFRDHISHSPLRFYERIFADGSWM